jgi:nucleotide-sensitive chloride channel 1A
MHAVSKDPTLSPNGSIYCQVAKARSEMTEEEREAEEDGEDLEPFGEVRFIPSDGSAVEALFEAFSKGAEMNPDPLEGKLLQIKCDNTNHNDRG